MESARLQREQTKSKPVSDRSQRMPTPDTANSRWPLTLNDATSPALRLGHAFRSSHTPLPHALQAKLTVNEPGDQYEQEADRVAEQVMRMPDTTLHLQRKCGCGSTASGESCEECASQSVQLQRRATPEKSSSTSTASSVVHDVLRLPGQPLGAQTRAFMESRFGQDFSAVRVHTDERANASARAVSAAAYTVGTNVVFGVGRYAPQTLEGRRLLAHELAHTIQQQSSPAIALSRRLGVTEPAHSAEVEADKASETVAAGHSFRVATRTTGVLSRAKLDVTDIRADIDRGKTVHPDLFSWLHVMGDRLGEVGFGAQALTISKDNKTPAPDNPVSDDPSLPIQAFFFPSFIRHHDRTALVIGGFHGDEQPGFQIADALVAELQQPNSRAQRDLNFHTLIVPRLNPGGINATIRCNLQWVDLNRNFPNAPAKPLNNQCFNTATAPVQPETQTVLNVITAFKPQRILSLHSIGSAGDAGVFADPEKDPEARALACSMAGQILDPKNKQGNTRTTGVSCNPKYPGGATGETSLGAVGPALTSGQTTSVITLEAPEHKALSATGVRSVDAFMEAARSFIGDIDLSIIRDIRAFSDSARRLFLTGRGPSSDDILKRIESRIDDRIVQLNALGPPVKINKFSGVRGFSPATDPKTKGQAPIIFEKFTLTGSRSGGWDTLPDAYFTGGNRSKGVDRKKWLAETSAKRLDIILQYTAVPGASRHHWGTDVDFNSTENADWAPAAGKGKAGKYNALGVWLQTNAAQAGFVQAYTPGRSGGHQEEAWHFSYAPLAISLRAMFNKDVKLDQDVVDPLMDFFTTQATAAKITLPSDLRPALDALDILKYVNTIGPGL